MKTQKSQWLEDLRKANNFEQVIVAMDEFYQRLKELTASLLERKELISADILIPLLVDDMGEIKKSELDSLIYKFTTAERFFLARHTELSDQVAELHSELMTIDPEYKKQILNEQLSSLTRALSQEENEKRRNELSDQIANIRTELRALPDAPSFENHVAVQKKRETLDSMKKEQSKVADLLQGSQHMGTHLLTQRIALEFGFNSNDPEFRKWYVDENKKNFNQRMFRYMDGVDTKIKIVSSAADSKKLALLELMAGLLEEGEEIIKTRLKTANLSDAIATAATEVLGSPESKSLETFTGLRLKVEDQIKKLKSNIDQAPGGVSDEDIKRNLSQFRSVVSNFNTKIIAPMEKDQSQKPLLVRAKEWLTRTIKFQQSTLGYFKSLHSALSFFEKKLDRQREKAEKIYPNSKQLRF